MAWSSGKDSAFALHEARRAGLVIAGILTTMNEVYDRVAMHGVRHSLLNRQIAALDLPAITVPIPSPCPNEIYEARMEEACAAIKAQGIRHLVFGDLFLEDIRAYRVEKLSAAGMEPGCRSRVCQHVSAATRRLHHIRRTAIALGILEAA